MNKVMKVIVPLLLVAVIIFSIGWYLFVYDRDFTRDMLLQQARYQNDLGNTKLASWFYDLAYRHSGQDHNVAIELANQYKNAGNYTKAEYTLSNAIADAPSVELYTALCKVFVEQDKLLDAINLLDKIADPALKEQMAALRPLAPEVDYAPGFYSQYISVTLETGTGTVYYSVDGDYPSISDPMYTEPIALGQGETTIKAVCVNESGLVSPLTNVGYTISGVIEPVTLDDPAINSAIRSMLVVSESYQLYSNELWTITEFTVPAEADSLEDLGKLNYLVSLTIENLAIESLDVLNNLVNLEELNLINCRFSSDDLTYLAALPSLKKLTMDSCNLSTITGLSNAQNLVYLDLSNNTIRNLAPLASMPELTELYLDSNAVTNLSDLSGLSKLQVLDVSYNSLTSIAPIATCLELRELNISNNQLSDLGVIDNLPYLNVLKADNNSLSDITVLSECLALTELRISGNDITDISALSTLTNLEYFDFSYNAVTALPDWSEGGALRTIDGSYNQLESINILKHMENLSYVYMDYNALTNVDALEACQNLVQVNVYGNAIPDVSALTEHDIIVNYDPTAA